AEAEPGARELPVIRGRMLGGRLIMCARLAGASQRLGRAALPVVAACERDRVRGSFADAGEVLIGGLRVVGETQRDPARGEFVLSTGIVLCPRHGGAGGHISGLVFFKIKQPARDQPALGPPFLEVMQLGRAVWGGL